MRVKDLVFCLRVTLLHAMSAQTLRDSQGCTANNQSTITITESNGTIPSSPGLLPVNATCKWNIMAPVGKVLRLNITASFQKPCSDNYLRIYDGPSDASDKIAEYNCNSTSLFYGTGAIFHSSGRSLWLQVTTGITENSAAMHVSFQAQEKQECSTNSTLVAPKSPTEHNFSSPYYPYGYHRNATCGWFITAPENHVVKVHFLSQLNNWNTVKESVKIYDVDDTELTLIDLQSWKIYSKFRFVHVVFKNDKNVDGGPEQGIFVQYSTVKTVSSCSLDNSDDENMNIVLRNASGVIKSPWYPHGFPYELLDKCHWKIIAPKGKVVRIEFLSFRVHEVYAQISDRINRMNPRIVKFSGKLPSFNFYSTGHELSIMVKGYRNNDGAGFIANYSSVPTVSSGTCNLNKGSIVHMTGEGRSFSSPGYPLNPGIGYCSWNITVPPGNFVKVTFWEMVGSSALNYATVYDMTNSTWRTLGEYTRNDRVNEFYSIGNSVFVEYKSMYLFYPGGFIASFEALKATPARYRHQYPCSRPWPYWWSRNVVTLWGSSPGDEGEFASFDYPLSYPNDVKCSWEIKARAGTVIQLTFHSFHLEPSNHGRCWDDSVVISQQSQGSGWKKRIGTFCGSSIPAVIQSNYSSVYVDFESDSSGRYPGFHASYKILLDPAMGPCIYPYRDNVIPLTGETGRLFSPLYPRNLAISITCTWVITVPKGHFVRLRIKDLILKSESGYRSTLYIRDGQNSSSGLLKKYGDDESFQTSMFSSGRYLRVQFDSRKGYQSSYVSKFDAVFEAVRQVPAPFSCTETNQITYLKSKSGSLASYNFPLPYDERASCTWEFKMDSHYKIQLSFDFFNVSCKYDRVNVLNKNFCGSEKPPSVTLTTSDSVDFWSSGYASYPGFKASYRAEGTNGGLSPLKIVGISFGAVFALCVTVFIGYKCWRKNNRVPQVAVVHSLTNDVETEQEQDTTL